MKRAPLLRMAVLGEEYAEVRDLRTKLWGGTLVYFPDPPEMDVKCYMMVFNRAEQQFELINWVGYKAGLKLILASIPQAALCEGAYAVRLGWFKENWQTIFLPFGSFETTKFLVWKRSLDPKVVGKSAGALLH
ncbi:hypothetical protein [Frigidibacter sp. SD6-1]|uniref:hypothetical protein n=1 Tax=Frigidibacter sp. SD6-1 TaxID=3032581 RepID=UPI0024DF3D6D|nr:hypothetical protein [Frigidibacter sp. SD6-1]